MSTLVWNGTPQEFGLLAKATNHNCSCDDDSGYRCTVHQLTSDQRIMDHLLFAFRMSKIFLAQEFREEEKVAPKEQGPSTIHA